MRRQPCQLCPGFPPRCKPSPEADVVEGHEDAYVFGWWNHHSFGDYYCAGCYYVRLTFQVSCMMKIVTLANCRKQSKVIPPNNDWRVEGSFMDYGTVE